MKKDNDELYQDYLFDSMKEECEKMAAPVDEPDSIFALADRLRMLKEEKSDLEARSKELGKQIEEIDSQLSGAMSDAELDKFSRNGKTFYLTTRLFASPKEGLSDELFQILREKGYGEIIKETVNANTLASFTKEQKEQNGDEVPSWLEEVINVYEKVSVGIRKN